MLHIKKRIYRVLQILFTISACTVRPLSDEIHHNNMQNYMGQNEISESPFRWNADKLGLVLWISLQTKAHWNQTINEISICTINISQRIPPKKNIYRITSKHKATDSRNEARQKRIERKCTDQTAIHELCDTGQNDVQQVGVDNLQLLRCVVDVFVVEFGYHCLEIRHFGMFAVFNGLNKCRDFVRKCRIFGTENE